MPARTGHRRRLTTLPLAALITAALPVAGALAQAPGLPRTFTAMTIDSPESRGGGSFGWGLASADLNRDGKLDLLVPQAQDAAATRVYIFDGATGLHIDTIAPPELNPDGSDPVIAFTYVETMPDIGSCPGGDGPDAGKICDLPLIAAGDGVPEIIVGARGLRVSSSAHPPGGETPATAGDPQIGRGYVIDGATRAVLKRIDMPLPDRAAQASLTPNTPAPQFARVMASLQALPPCAGAPAENNNQGVGPCPAMSRRDRIGDLDGDDFPDIVITARNYVETSQEPDAAVPHSTILAAAAGSQCQNATTGAVTPTRCTSGKAWAYSGQLIAGTDPQAILDTAMYPIKNPLAQTGGQEFGGNLYRIGDVNSAFATCAATPADPTCAPEFVITARNLSYPFASPTQEFTGVGAAFLVNGATGAVLSTPSGTAITSPEPQKLSQFSGSFNGGRPVGDLGASSAPDILLPAALQNASSTDDGKIWAFNAVSGGGGATGSWQFASMGDPNPVPGGNFGGAFTGVGNLVPGLASPANELLVGGFRFDPSTEAADDVVADVHFVNVQRGTNLMTIPNPTGARGDGFGVGLVPMGDLNGDGFLDFAASSYLANIKTGGDGRAFIFRSDNTPPPAPPTAAAPIAAGPVTPATTGRSLQAGACTNRTIGTDLGETLEGTLAGDEIFGFAGKDTIWGFQGEDCIDGGPGNDTIHGGAARDKLIGAGGGDVLRGDDGRDDLFGGFRSDRLYGGFGRDMIAGGVGNDLLDGGADADSLFGEAGKDRIIGGDGRNRIDGGSGNDSIDSRNGEVDRVICGTGRDKVTADRSDRLNGCETVRFKRTAKK
jgi:Ca2+-binding RTX toxin-like protein